MTRIEIIPPRKYEKGWQEVAKEVAEKHGCVFIGADPEMNAQIRTPRKNQLPHFINDLLGINARSVGHAWFSVSPLQINVVTELGMRMAHEIQQVLDE